MPGAQCTRCRACSVENTRVSHHGYTGITRHSRTRMVLTASFVLSPVIGLSCHRHLSASSRKDLTPASRRQDHTTSPSASALFVQQRLSVHRIPSRVDDVGQRPSVGKDARTSAPDLPDGTSKIFFARGLDRWVAKRPDGQINRSSFGPKCERRGVPASGNFAAGDFSGQESFVGDRWGRGAARTHQASGRIE